MQQSASRLDDLDQRPCVLGVFALPETREFSRETVVLFFWRAVRNGTVSRRGHVVLLIIVDSTPSFD